MQVGPGEFSIKRDVPIVGQRLRGGVKTYHVNLGVGKRTAACALQTTFGGPRNWGWSGQRLFLLGEMTESRQKGGGGNVS